MPGKSNHEPWIDAGIPGQCRVERLLYNRPSNTLVAVVNTLVEGSKLSVFRHYVRAATATHYSPVNARHDCESQMSAACCEAAPFMIYNEWRFRAHEETSTHAADWECVAQVDLATGIGETVLDAYSLRPPPPYNSGWISDILAAWPDGSGAVCKIALAIVEGNAKLAIGYFVYDVSFKDGLVRQITSLPHIFL